MGKYKSEIMYTKDGAKYFDKLGNELHEGVRR